jgi:DNA invertase Pin-like site-specific DNA recombinase
MAEFLQIKSLAEKEEKKIREEIEQRIEQKKKEGVYSEREIRAIEEMRLRPLPDNLDVQSVYEDYLFK